MTPGSQAQGTWTTATGSVQPGRSQRAVKRMGAGPEVVVMSIRVEVLCVNGAGSEPRREVLSIERSELVSRWIKIADWLVRTLKGFPRF